MSSKEFFGQYGEINRIFVSKTPYYLKLTNDYCHSAYITYKDELSACLAIAGLDKYIYKGKRLEASYGTNKFCRYYLNDQPCRNRNCNFIHYEVKKGDIFLKHENLENKTIFESKKITLIFFSISLLKKKQNINFSIGQKTYAYKKVWAYKSQIRRHHTRVRYSTLPLVKSILKKTASFIKKQQTNSQKESPTGSNSPAPPRKVLPGISHKNPLFKQESSKKKKSASMKIKGREESSETRFNLSKPIFNHQYWNLRLNKISMNNNTNNYFFDQQQEDEQHELYCSENSYYNDYNRNIRQKNEKKSNSGKNNQGIHQSYYSNSFSNYNNSNDMNRENLRFSKF